MKKKKQNKKHLKKKLGFTPKIYEWNLGLKNLPNQLYAVFKNDFVSHHARRGGLVKHILFILP